MEIAQFRGKQIRVEISGNKRLVGVCVDYGLDILVLYAGQRYFYVPLGHIQQVGFDVVPDATDEPTAADPTTADPTVAEQAPAPFDEQGSSISYRKILQQAKGMFVEIYVSGNLTLHGYLTAILNDYFVFHSPVFKTVYVSLNHLKWLIPYLGDMTPYSLDAESIPFIPPATALVRTFKEQCKKMQGSLVVFDLGDHPNKIGLVKSVDVNTSLLELVTATGGTVLWNIQHLKTAYLR